MSDIELCFYIKHIKLYNCNLNLSAQFSPFTVPIMDLGLNLSCRVGGCKKRGKQITVLLFFLQSSLCSCPHFHQSHPLQPLSRLHSPAPTLPFALTCSNSPSSSPQHIYPSSSHPLLDCSLPHRTSPVIYFVWNLVLTLCWIFQKCKISYLDFLHLSQVFWHELHLITGIINSNRKIQNSCDV